MAAICSATTNKDANIGENTSSSEEFFENSDDRVLQIEILCLVTLMDHLNQARYVFSCIFVAYHVFKQKI